MEAAWLAVRPSEDSFPLEVDDFLEIVVVVSRAIQTLLFGWAWLGEATLYLAVEATCEQPHQEPSAVLQAEG